MAITETESIWMNGKLVPWRDAKVHVLSHVLHYGSSVFEGIRVYDTSGGPAFFRLREHLERLFASASIYRMKIPYTLAELEQACAVTMQATGLRQGYLRPLVYRGYGVLGVDGTASPIDVAIAAIAWGRYLGADAIENGVDVCVSSWRRNAPSTMPNLAKAGGNYLSSQLIHMEASRNGFVEGIALGCDGMLSEGAGENVFLVDRGALITPGQGHSILAGITRDTVITLARTLGIEVVETAIPREMLYLAEEVFLTGTAAEITPVRSVDGAPVGNGARGPITKAIQDAFFGLFDGRTEDRWGWLRRLDALV